MQAAAGLYTFATKSVGMKSNIKMPKALHTNSISSLRGSLLSTPANLIIPNTYTHPTLTAPSAQQPAQ